MSDQNKTHEEKLHTEDEQPEAVISEQEDTDPVTDSAEATTEDATDTAAAGESAEEIARLKAERDELRDQLLRARAEFDNYKKRTLRDMERIRKRAAEGLLADLLPVVDNLERALAHGDDASESFAEGVRMVLQQFCGVLERHGVEPIPAAGEAFDPNVHEALSHLPSPDHAPDMVTEEYERGYRIGDYVLRPSKVVVSSGPPAPAPETAADAGEEE